MEKVHKPTVNSYARCAGALIIAAYSFEARLASFDGKGNDVLTEE